MHGVPGSIRTQFFCCIFQKWHHHQFWNFLKQCYGLFWGPGRAGGCPGALSLVELVRNHTFQYGRHGLIAIQTSFPEMFVLAAFSFEGWSASNHESKRAALRSKALNSSAQTVSNQSPTTKTQGWTKCRLDDSHTACRSFNVCIVKLWNWMKSTTDPVCLWIPAWHEHDRCWPSAMTYLFCQRIGFCAFH